MKDRPSEKPLSEKSVLVTRATGQASELSDLLRDAGATVFEVPVIEIRQLPEGKAEWLNALNELSRYSWLILTSVNTVKLIQDWLLESLQDWSIFSDLHIACIGTATAKKVQEYGGTVSLVPPEYRAESLAEVLKSESIAGKNILLPRAAGSREILPRLLSESGASVREILLYRAVLPEESRAQLVKLFTRIQPDFITFTSSSTVRNFFEVSSEFLENIDATKTRIACIGPITASTLRELGHTPAVEAAEFTIPGLVHSIITFVLRENNVGHKES